MSALAIQDRARTPEEEQASNKVNIVIVPLRFAEACAFVAQMHRHHRPPAGHKFSIGVVVDGTLVGAAIIGRPVARLADDGMTLEVTRTCTDGTRNANSALYGAAWKAAKALGYTRLITFTQGGESGECGSSLRGAGWRIVGERPARGGWSCTSRPRADHGTAGVQRTLWEQVSA